ncbi:MAG: serine/threonine protein kinase [Minicystis sp.]
MSISTDPTEPSPRRCPRHGAIGSPAHAGLCPRCLLDAPDLWEDDEPVPSIVPRRFGAYDLQDRLGQGGMGVVYKARLVSIGRVVALKRMLEGSLAGPDARARFLREAKAATELRHPNIVPIHDVGEHEGELYFTMELMPGGTLAAAQDRFTDPQHAAALVRTLARAVHEGHQKGIIHRDLKPDNILFDGAGNPHVADFGIAKWLDPDSGIALSSYAAGTTAYMAPEQAGGEATRAADIWSLGVILYQLVAATLPFEGPAGDRPLTPLHHRRPSAGRDLAAVCHKCLSLDPKHRYPSAEALADDLDRCLRGEIPEARRAGRAAHALRWCVLHPAPSAILGAAAVALVSLTLWAFAEARDQERARRAEVIDTNVYAARAVAGTVLHELDEYGEWLAQEAKNPEIAEDLESGDDEDLGVILEIIRARHDGTPYWFIVDKEGTLRAHVPYTGYIQSYAINYAFRDYFRGAKALPADAERPVYVSRAFNSTSDHRYKLAVASPIRGKGGAFAGVLVAEIATDRRLGALDLNDAHRFAVLAVRHDRESAAAEVPDEHLLLVHNGVEHGEGVIIESAALRKLAKKRDAAGPSVAGQLHLPPPDWVEPDGDHRDPLAPGPWLAGVAAVGRTDLAVIVQTRVADATRVDAPPWRVQIAQLLGGAVLLCAGLFASLRKRAARTS